LLVVVVAAVAQADHQVVQVRAMEEVQALTLLMPQEIRAVAVAVLALNKVHLALTVDQVL
jgi:hypothetical protein